MESNFMREEIRAMDKKDIKNIYRGDIIWVDLGEFPGSHRQFWKKTMSGLISTDKEMVRYIQ